MPSWEMPCNLKAKVFCLAAVAPQPHYPAMGFFRPQGVGQKNISRESQRNESEEQGLPDYRICPRHR